MMYHAAIYIVYAHTYFICIYVYNVFKGVVKLIDINNHLYMYAH